METKVDENRKSIPATLTPTPLACFLMDNPLLWAGPTVDLIYHTGKPVTWQGEPGYRI